MAKHVTDVRSNPNEQIDHAVEVIGRSNIRLDVFKAIYRGKKKRKTAIEIAEQTNLTVKQVLTAGKRLADNSIVSQSKVDGRTAYEKDSFFGVQRDKILALLRNPQKRKADNRL